MKNNDNKKTIVNLFSRSIYHLSAASCYYHNDDLSHYKMDILDNLSNCVFEIMCLCKLLNISEDEINNELNQIYESCIIKKENKYEEP